MENDGYGAGPAILSDGIAVVIKLNYHGQFGPTEFGKQKKAREAPRPLLPLRFASSFSNCAFVQHFAILACLFALLFFDPRSGSSSGNKQSLSMKDQQCDSEGVIIICVE